MRRQYRNVSVLCRLFYAQTTRKSRFAGASSRSFSDGYIAPYPEAHGRYGKNPRELVEALQEHGAPWLVDLCTPALCERDVARAGGWVRLRETAFAEMFALPLDPAVLQDDAARNAFVDANVAFQLGAPMLSAPYLEFDHDDDPRLEANLAMLGRVVGAAAGRLVAGSLQISLDSLNRGLPSLVASLRRDRSQAPLPARAQPCRRVGDPSSAVGGHVRAVQARFWLCRAKSGSAGLRKRGHTDRGLLSLCRPVLLLFVWACTCGRRSGAARTACWCATCSWRTTVARAG